MSQTIDSWPATPKSTGKRPYPSPDTTPSRSSRTKGINNHIQHTSFNRTASTSQPVTFNVGDQVIISSKAPCRQKWLQTPSSIKKSIINGKTRKAKKQVVHGINDPYEGWQHIDGLTVERVAIILELYEDESEVKMVKLRWFARPGAVWGPDPQDEAVEDVSFIYILSFTTHKFKY